MHVGVSRIWLNAVLIGWFSVVTTGAYAQEALRDEGRHIPQEELVGKLIPITGDSRSLDLNLLFRFGSSELSDSAQRQLDALAGALTSETLKNARVSVNGHTDAVGSAEENLSLSEKRAASVVHYLVNVHGLAADRFTARGFGEQHLLPLVPPESESQRRVEIVTTLPAPSPEQDRDRKSDDAKGSVVID